MNKKLNNKGFSLVELIIVIAIMAVLVGVLAPQFIKYVEQSRRSTDISNAEEIRSAILADIADAELKGKASNVAFTGTKTEASGAYTALGATTISSSAVPKVQGNVVNNGGNFYVTFDASAGTCSVSADKDGKFVLTEASSADNYKDGKDKDGTTVSGS